MALPDSNSRLEYIMRSSRRISDIIAAVYSRRYRLKPRRPVLVDDHYLPSVGSDLFDQGKSFLRSHAVILLIGVVIFLKIYLALTYYNRLVVEESNMRASYSNMNVVIQRRNDIGRNLIQAIHYYSNYEERVYSKIVSLRTSPPNNEEPKESSPDTISEGHAPAEENAGALAAVTGGLSAGSGLAPFLPKLLAVAEQYPDLKSEMNYTVLLAALVELEKDLASQRIKFNADANIYSTTLRQFPSNIFAWIFRFNEFPYFDASQEAKEFKIAE